MAITYDRELESALDREILHELEGEFEGAAHLEDELAMSLEGGGSLHEFEDEGELFFGRLRRAFRGVGRFIRRAAPMLGRIAKIAAPLVATAVGGPLGGIIARGATSLLGEGELEDELAHELSHEMEGLHEGHLEGVMHEGHPESILHELEATHEFGHHEATHEFGHHEGHPESILHELEGTHEFGHHEGHPESILHELEAIHEFGHHEGHPESILHELEATHEFGHHEATHEHAQHMMAELMAEVAAGAHLEAEAEAMVGAAVVTTLSAADRAALRRLIPHLIRGAAILTRILRMRRITRPAVRTVPTIVRQTAQVLRRRAASGAPVSRRVAGQVMGSVTRRVLGSPRACGLAIGRNVRATMRSRSGMSSVAG
jgi:hypothetical protein